MKAAEIISSELSAAADTAQAAILSRFFKTGPGEYGEGDRFLGVKVPVTRAIVKGVRKFSTLDDVDLLTRSTFHEERLAGFLLLIELYEEAKRTSRRRRRGESDLRTDDSAVTAIVNYYHSILERGNNWDLVDLVAPKILGDRLQSGKDAEPILMQLAASDNLWKQRVSIVATLPLIRKNDFDLTFDLVICLATHPHDLIHKACGWMLREVGKRNEKMLLAFLDHYCTILPRTTLRYAIERLEERHRVSYLMRKDDADYPEARRNEKRIPMSHRLTLPKKRK